MSRGPGRPRTDGPPVAPTAELLELALDAFAEQGYEATSVRDLCRRLGVSHNLVHQRFGSKDQLWYAAVDHGFSALTVELARAAQAAPDDDLARLRAVLVRFVEVTAASPALLRVISSEATRPGVRLDHIYERYVGPAMDVVNDTWNRLAAEGRVKPVPPAVLHFLVAYGAAGPLAMRPLAAKFGRSGLPRGRDVTAYANEVIDLLLFGMASNAEQERHDHTAV